MIAAIYIRVSTKTQEYNFSLSAQELELKQFAQKNSWPIYKVYRDIGSGNDFNKYALSELMEDAEQKKFDILLVVEQDRLSRLETIEWELVKSVLKDNEIKIATPFKTLDLSDEKHEFISDLKNLIANRERKKNTARTLRGKIQRVKEGKPLTRPPIGYVLNPNTGKHEIDQKWAWLIPYIDALYLNEKFGVVKITSELNEICKSPNDSFWYDNQVSRILTNTAYHGEYTIHFRNLSQTYSIPNVYPPLRTKDTYNRIQEERKSRTSKNKRKPSIFKLVKYFCGYCQFPMSISSTGDKNSTRFVVRHNRRQNYNLKIKGMECNNTITISKFESIFLSKIKAYLRKPEFYQQYHEFNKQWINDQSKRKVELQKKLSNLIKEKESLLDDYLESRLSSKEVNQKSQALNFEEDKIKKLMSEIKKKDIVSPEQAIYSYLSIIETIETSLSLDERIDLVSQLFPSATVINKAEVIFHGNFFGMDWDLKLRL